MATVIPAGLTWCSWPARTGRAAGGSTRIASRGPGRYRVVAGEPALLSDLRARYQAEAGSSSDADAFARYVRRAAVVTLERAERRLIGDRYKVPRLVAEQITDRPAFRAELSALAVRLGLTEQEVDASAAAGARHPSWSRSRSRGGDRPVVRRHAPALHRRDLDRRGR